MKLSAICRFGLLAITPAIAQRPLAPDGLTFPRNILDEATTLTKDITTKFENTGSLLGAITISNTIVTQLGRLNSFMTSDVFPVVNPQRFKPGTPGKIRARTCAERMAIFKAYENFFDAVIVARQAAGAAVCRSTVKVEAANAAVEVLTRAAKDELDKISNNIRRLWDQNFNKYNSFQFFVFHCKERNNPADCRVPGDECESGQPCPPVCPCYYGFVDGKNPNVDQCFTDEDRVEEVGGVSGESSRASFGWLNIKDCRECFPDATTLPTCINALDPLPNL